MKMLPEWSYDNLKMFKTFCIGTWPRKLKSIGELTTILHN